MLTPQNQKVADEKWKIFPTILISKMKLLMKKLVGYLNFL